MTDIKASEVKALREYSGAGMMDCKRALAEAGGDLDAAVDWLRAKGLAKAAKKSGRIAAEGLVGLAVAGNRGAVVEVNAETDFVARNASFQSFVTAMAGLALATEGGADAVLAARWPGVDRTAADQLTETIAVIGEHLALRRCAALSVDGPGVVASYVHAAIAPDLGRIGVLVGLASSGDPVALQALGRQIAMHVAAARPEFLNPDAVDPAAVARERAVLLEQARESGKPDAVIAKIVEGRLRKYIEDVCLIGQIFVIDGERTIAKVLQDAESIVGAPIRVTGFLRYGLGEGLERKSEDFAAEVEVAMRG